MLRTALGRPNHRSGGRVTAAALALAAALLVGGQTRARRSPGPRCRPPEAGAPTRVSPTDPLAAAWAFDIFAVCLSSGMTISGAAQAAAGCAPVGLAEALRYAAGLLALGADPVTAWAPSVGTAADDHTLALLRLARRSARSGAALSDGVAELAVSIRHQATDSAVAAAERASVVIAGPLGVCFLPAFVCLGVVPVVAGLAGDVLGTGLF